MQCRLCGRGAVRILVSNTRVIVTLFRNHPICYYFTAVTKHIIFIIVFTFYVVFGIYYFLITITCGMLPH